MEILRLQLLGELRLSQGSLLLSNTLSKKAQALLCYLALTGQPQSREKLAGLLWSDFPDRRARANLRDTLYLLHRVVSNSLTTNQNWISLTVDPARSWIDVVAFQSAIEQVRQSLRRSHSPVLLPAELVGCLEEAVKLYRGELLSGFYVRRAVLFEEWLADRREQMRQLAVEALQILTAYYMAGGSYTAGLSHARHLLALEPWREEGHRQVMRLLALSGQQSAALIQYEACRRILSAELGLEPAAETTALCDAIRAGDVRPETVDTHGYELLELIGKGQMSSVYCAYQPAVKRKVAVKIVQAESPRSPQFFDRFESVTQTIAALEFPWIVPIYDFWRDADAATIVMRLMRGGNLKDNLDGKSWPVATAVTLLEQIAAALAAAHEADIVHGNLKSENILLDAAGNAYLSDFGLASQAASGERLALTGGSASYLSPEQRLGQQATTRSDVYSLGLILGELLTGTPPLGPETRPDKLTNGAEGPSRLSTAAGDELPADVAEVIQQATAQQPDERYPDVLAMASALREAVKSDRLQQMPLSTGLFRRQASTLPEDETPFIGREEELFILNKLIADPSLRLISISGPGGIGKTRVALAVARQQVDRFRQGVHFVSLLAAESSDQIISAIAAALALPLQNERSPRQGLLDYLRDKHLLLVLDNFEHLVDEGDLLSAMLGGAAGLTILVTTRELLNLHEEQVFPLAGLTLPDSDSADTIMRADAAQLFLNSARRLQPDFTLYDADIEPLQQICRLVEGMPLALELAAGWSNKLALPQIAGQLGHSLDFLRTAGRQTNQRHRSMRAVFAASWQQLGAEDQRVLKNLSVFRGGFTLEAARRVADISFVSLSRLASKSLLHFDRETDRYQMHELVRQYAALWLAQDKDQEAAIKVKHAAYFCRLMGTKEADLKSSRQNAALAELDADLANFRKAWKSAAERGRVDLVECALDGFALTYRYRFLPDEFVRICQIAIHELEELASSAAAPAGRRRTLAKIKALQATPYRHATIGSDFLATRSSLQILQQSGDILAELAASGEDVRSEQALVFMRQGVLQLNIERRLSRPLLEQSLALYQQLDDHWGQSEALLHLSSAVLRLEGYRAAKPLWEKSLALRRAAVDRRGLAESLTMLGIRAAAHNETGDTRRYAQECYDTYIHINDPASHAEAHWNSGVLMTWAGQYRLAKQSLMKAEMLYLELGLRPPALILGNTLAMLGEYEAAVEYVELFMSRLGDTEDKPNEARAHNWLGYVALARGDYLLARRHFSSSAAAYAACGLQAYAGLVHGFLFLAARGLGDEKTRLQLMAQGLRIQIAISQLGPLGICLGAPAVAVLLADHGYLAEAVAAYAFARSHPMIANSVWFDQVAGSVVRTAASALSAERIRKAEQRGRQSDPWQMGAEMLALVQSLLPKINLGNPNIS